MQISRESDTWPVNTFLCAAVHMYNDFGWLYTVALTTLVLFLNSGHGRCGVWGPSMSQRNTGITGGHFVPFSQENISSSIPGKTAHGKIESDYRFQGSLVTGKYLLIFTFITSSTSKLTLLATPGQNFHIMNLSEKGPKVLHTDSNYRCRAMGFSDVFMTKVVKQKFKWKLKTRHSSR